MLHQVFQLLYRVEWIKFLLKVVLEIRHHVVVAQDLDRHAFVVRNGQLFAVRLETVLQFRPKYNRYFHMRELSSLVNLLNRLSLLMSDITHSPNANANRNKSARGTPPLTPCINNIAPYSILTIAAS